MSEIQTDVRIVRDGPNDRITGTLLPVEGWTEFSKTPDQQSGHYLGLLITPNSKDAKVVAYISDSDMDDPKVTVGEDHQIIFRVKSTTQDITVDIYEDGETDGEPSRVGHFLLPDLTLA